MSLWHPLDAEIARWTDAGLSLPFWWRDDDAVEPTSALDRLETLAQSFDLPLHLAVIPAGAKDTLAGYVGGRPHIVPLVHGWAHRNHAQANEKKCEFPASRLTAELSSDAAQGLARLQDLFGHRLAPVFVPPWNRIAPDLIQHLPGLGFAALSQYGPRLAPMPAPVLVQVNTHIDPIAWKTSRSLVPLETLIPLITANLKDRREGVTDAAEPLGLLTHHLVHDNAIWDFCETLLTRLAPIAAPWRADTNLSSGNLP